MAERERDPVPDDVVDVVDVVDDADEGPDEMIEAALDELANPADETNEG